MISNAWVQGSPEEYYGEKVDLASFVWTVFRQLEHIDTECAKVDSIVCKMPVVCGAVHDISPAGTAIVNSMVAIHTVRNSCPIIAVAC